MSVKDGVGLLGALLVVAVASRPEKPPSLSRRGQTGSKTGCGLDGGTSGSFGSVIDGIRVYAKVTGQNVSSLVAIVVERFTASQSQLFAIPRYMHPRLDTPVASRGRYSDPLGFSVLWTSVVFLCDS